MITRLPALIFLASLLAACATADRPLQLVAGAAAIYPAQARADGVEGQVEVAYGVAVDGRVVGAQVVAAEPAGVFDEAALTAVRQWRFNPPVRDGTAQPVERLTSTIRFRLSGSERYERYEP